MADMKELIRLMKALEDQLIVCMRCGLCQAVCPLYAQTGREADVARGKLALLDGLLQEMFDDPGGVNERLNRCLLCGSCAANCPSGVKVLEIFLKARAILTGYMGLPPLKKIILRGMLARPERLDRLASWAAKLQKLGVRPVNETVGTSCARLMSYTTTTWASICPEARDVAAFRRCHPAIRQLLPSSCAIMCVNWKRKRQIIW